MKIKLTSILITFILALGNFNGINASPKYPPAQNAMNNRAIEITEIITTVKVPNSYSRHCRENTTDELLPKCLNPIGSFGVDSPAFDGLRDLEHSYVDKVEHDKVIQTKLKIISSTINSKANAGVVKIYQEHYYGYIPTSPWITLVKDVYSLNMKKVGNVWKASNFNVDYEKSGNIDNPNYKK